MSELDRFLPKAQIEKLGPFWQWTCHNCDEMSDVYDTAGERNAGIADHSCGSLELLNDIHFELQMHGVTDPAVAEQIAKVAWRRVSRLKDRGLYG